MSHERPMECGAHLVVSMLAVDDEVEHHVTAEALAELHAQLARLAVHHTHSRLGSAKNDE